MDMVVRINVRIKQIFWIKRNVLKKFMMAANVWVRWSVSKRIILTEFQNFWENFIMFIIFQDGRQWVKTLESEWEGNDLIDNFTISDKISSCLKFFKMAASEWKRWRESEREMIN
jgi:hypothetical protein